MSIYIPFTANNYSITPTTTQSAISKTPADIQRKKSIITTPNRPLAVMKSSAMSDKHVPSMTNQRDNQLTSQINRDDLLRINPLVEEQHLNISLHQKYPTAHATDVVSSAAVNSQDHRRTSIIYNDFDAFILNKFIRFSGKENVILWLDQTEQKFNELHIGRNLRFKAISLLIEGAAKRKYLTHRKEIRSFDDFYEFLLSHFDISNLDTNQSDCDHCAADSQLLNLSPPFKPRSTDDLTLTGIHLCDDTKVTEQTPVFYSTEPVDVGATNTFGEMHATTSVAPSTNVSTSDCDRTLIDLRKAIFDHVIRNPKIFVAHLPHSTRLDLLSYSLRADALERFNIIDPPYSSLRTDPTQKIFSSIKCTRYKHRGHEALACFNF